MEIMAALERIVGPKRVTNRRALCESYKYNCFLGKEWEMKPDIVVLAETVEEVSRIVKAANEFRVPVTPKGAMGGGGLGGAFRGGILLDLSLMDRIVSIDTARLKAVAEAGCSFYTLSQELFKRGLMLPTPAYDCGPNVAASAITPANGFGKTKYGPNIDLVEGFEVVLPSGEIARVGAMAYSDTDFGPYYRYITGPDLVGLFTKSNGAFGIVTKVVYQCLLLPKHWSFHSYYWPLDRLADVTKTLMEATNIEAFDIHFNDKYRWDWEGPFEIPGDGYFDVTFMANGHTPTEMKGREEALHDICRANRGEYLPGLAQHLYLSWPSIFFAAHPRLRPATPPNVMTETLGERGYMYILDELIFPTSWLTEVYARTLELCEKHGLATLPMHPVFDGYPMRRQVISSQYWVYINDGKPEWVERFHGARDDFRAWFGERGGFFQTKFPPLVPDYAWTHQKGAFDLLRSLKKALDPNDILSPGTFDFGGAG